MFLKQQLTSIEATYLTKFKKEEEKKKKEEDKDRVLYPETKNCSI